MATKHAEKKSGEEVEKLQEKLTSLYEEITELSDNVKDKIDKGKKQLLDNAKEHPLIGWAAAAILGGLLLKRVLAAK